MTALEHSARVAAAREILAKTETHPDTYDAACVQRVALRAALVQVLGYSDHLLAMVNEAAQNQGDREAMDRYRAAMNLAGRL
jgi:hypothetical protein